ncbi:IclR family transcriptional regulator [Arthrobacter sp. NPDC090010]|uniref:IclR family transcriptional regulator n=1 Tax=Arthrobacter sp. NPDC090010 TaxID=3363942 RepID=UPI0037FE4649
MKKNPLREKPPYPIESVDNALRLLQRLRDVGALRLKDAAEEIGVAPSTAHRLLAMLVYRGFAVQDGSKRYLPGPSLGIGPAGLAWTSRLRRAAQVHLEMLAAKTGETVSLTIRVGTSTRFLDTVEGSGILRVGDRQGAVLPARFTSGGKALLAALDDGELGELFLGPTAAAAGEDIGAEAFEGLLAELHGVRQRGFAANIEGTETGVSALGEAVRDRAGRPVAAVSVAVPSSRFRAVLEGGLVGRLHAAVRQLERELAEQLE